MSYSIGSDAIKTLVTEVMKTRREAVNWQPNPKGAFFSPNEGASTHGTVLVPKRLIDDDNLLIAILDLTTVPERDAELSELARRVEKTARLLQGAVLDAGLHRLLTVVCVVPTAAVAEAVGSGGEHASQGELRVLTLDVGTSLTMIDDDVQRIANALEPFEKIEPFIKAIPESEDAAAAKQILRGKEQDPQRTGLWDAAAADVVSFLEDGGWSETPWPRSTIWLREVPNG